VADVRKVPRAEWSDKRIRDIMTDRQQLAVARPDEDATSAFDKLAARDVEQLPVLEGGRFVGLFRRRDVVRWLDLQNRGLPSLRQRRA
jgi:CBS domain-containing protein